MKSIFNQVLCVIFLFLAGVCIFINFKDLFFSILGIGLIVATIFLILWPRKKEAASPSAASDFSTANPTMPVLPRENVTPSDPETEDKLPRDLEENLRLFILLLPELEKLRDLVVGETEKATITLTKDIFNLTQVSEDVTQRISQCLEKLCRGDSGLGMTAEKLQSKTVVFQKLSQNFYTLKSVLSKDIQNLKVTVEKINEFSANISDLADQTNILAINASIEAARVGVQGKGFSVIANQVQILAKNSKEIAEKMALIVQEVVHAVDESFIRQGQRVGEAEIHIAESEKDLTQIAQELIPQVGDVEKNFDEIHEMSQVVSEQLSSITVALQFQDRIRQVLEHMSQALGDVSGQISASGQLDVGGAEDSQYRTKVSEILSRYFTMREEFEALNIGHLYVKKVNEADNVVLF